nr:molybdenum cofactor guanylyltransferase [Oscillochloris trichoides]
MTSVAGIIIAGGRAQRMGWDKRRARLWGADGPTLLEHTVALIAPLCTEVIVVLNDPDAWPGIAARLVADRVPGTGALGGLYTGLCAATTPTALVVAADMPLLNPALLRAMIATPFAGDALVPVARSSTKRHRYEPLHAIYRTTCLPAIQAALAVGNYALHALLAQLHLTTLNPDLLALHDPDGHALRNINTPEEWHSVQYLLRNLAYMQE